MAAAARWGEPLFEIWVLGPARGRAEGWIDDAIDPQLLILFILGGGAQS